MVSASSSCGRSPLKGALVAARAAGRGGEEPRTSLMWSGGSATRSASSPAALRSATCGAPCAALRCFGSFDNQGEAELLGLEDFGGELVQELLAAEIGAKAAGELGEIVELLGGACGSCSAALAELPQTICLRKRLPARRSTSVAAPWEMHESSWRWLGASFASHGDATMVPHEMLEEAIMVPQRQSGAARASLKVAKGIGRGQATTRTMTGGRICGPLSLLTKLSITSSCALARRLARTPASLGALVEFAGPIPWLVLDPSSSPHSWPTARCQSLATLVALRSPPSSLAHVLPALLRVLVRAPPRPPRPRERSEF